MGDSFRPFFIRFFFELPATGIVVLFSIAWQFVLDRLRLQIAKLYYENQRSVTNVFRAPRATYFAHHCPIPLLRIPSPNLRISVCYLMIHDRIGDIQLLNVFMRTLCFLVKFCLATRPNEQSKATLELPLQPQKCTVWGGLLAGRIIGPHFLKNETGQVTVNGELYRTMITNFLFPEVVAHDVGDIWLSKTKLWHTQRTK